MLNGLDLFSGIGGNSLALKDWVWTIAYCEADRHAQAVLLSRMGSGDLRFAPIWDDVTSLRGDMFDVPIDFIVAGFPCQDISVAGNGAGLAGERSGLVFEVFRLVKELKPQFVFLENVPAIRTRGGERVVKELAALGYDCRWDHLSAFDVGAPHKRERWFLLAHRNGDGCRKEPAVNGGHPERSNTEGCSTGFDIGGQTLANASGESKSQEYKSYDAIDQQWAPIRWGKLESSGPGTGGGVVPGSGPGGNDTDTARAQSAGLHHDVVSPSDSYGWWSVEPDVGRVANGVPFRVDRLKRLGNGVVPAQAREAFRRLIGTQKI